MSMEWIRTRRGSTDGGSAGSGNRCAAGGAREVRQPVVSAEQVAEVAQALVAGALDIAELAADRDGVALLRGQSRHPALDLRLDLHLDLVGHDDGDRLALGDGVTDGDEPVVELALLHRHGHLRHADGHLGHGQAPFASCRAAATMSGIWGTDAFSSSGPYAMGTSRPQSRTIGALRVWKVSDSAMRAAISAANPAVRGASWTSSAFPVAVTSARMVASSSGVIVRGSTTVTSMPSPASSSAAASDLPTMIAVATMVRSLPRRHTSALPSGT